MYKILIVDDEKIERNGIRMLLNSLGYSFEIAEANNGQTAYVMNLDMPSRQLKWMYLIIF